jgi:hypothetical protein
MTFHETDGSTWRLSRGFTNRATIASNLKNYPVSTHRRGRDMANAAAAGELKATQKLYGSFWKVSTTATAAKNGKEAIALSLTNLAEALDRNMTPTLLTSYAASLEDLTQEEIIQAFSRAHDELRFFPAPAILREFSGRPVTGDPIAAEAREEFQRILVAMRGKHGPKLRPILGRVLYGTEDDPKNAEGERVALCDAPRAESTVFPLSRRTEAALIRLGWGDRSAGIALIADHPSLHRQSWNEDDIDDQFKKNQLRAGDEILKRFIDAYRECNKPFL